MLFKIISLRIDPVSLADKLIRRMDASVPNPNRVVVVEYEGEDAGGHGYRFIRTLGHMEVVLRKFPEIVVKRTIYSNISPRVYVYLPETVSERDFYSELNTYFRSPDVQADVGRSAVRLNDMLGYDAQLKAAIKSHIEDLERMIDDHEIEEADSRRINEEEKSCLRAAFRCAGSYFLTGRKVEGDFHVLVSGIKGMLKAKQGLPAILALMVLELQLNRKEAEDFLSIVFDNTHLSNVSNEVLQLAEISGELDHIDEHLLVADMSDSRKADKLKNYIIWKSYEIAKRCMRKRAKKLDEEQAQLMAYRALAVGMNRRLGLAMNMNLIEDREERRNLARRVYFVDALVARDLNLEELHYSQREGVFLTSHTEEARVILEEVKKRFGGKTAMETLTMMRDLREFFIDEFKSIMLNQLHSCVTAFLTEEGRSEAIAVYWPVIHDFAREVLSKSILHGSSEYSERNTAFTRELLNLNGLAARQVVRLLDAVNSFLLNYQMPKIEMRLKTLQSIYEKIRRLRYKKMEREHREAQRKARRLDAEYSDFEVNLDDVTLTHEDIREYVQFAIPAGMNHREVFRQTKDEKVHDVVAYRFVVETPEDRLGILSWLGNYGVILESEPINKPHGYRAVHVKLWETLFFNEVVEVQIRDEEAHKQAEYGDAHHRFWKGAERVPVLSAFHTFKMFLNGMGGVMFVPVEVYHHTKTGEVESVERDFVVLRKWDNKYDLLVQGGYYRSCVNAGRVGVLGERVTRVDLKSGFYRVYNERLAAQVNSLRSRLRVEIAMAQEADTADFVAKKKRMESEYKLFIDRLRSLTRELNLEDLDMVYGGLVVDDGFRAKVNRYLEIEQKVEMKRLWVVVGDRKERYIKLTINVPNRAGMIYYWADMLRQMGFRDVEEFSSKVRDGVTSDLVFVFKGDLNDEINNAMRDALSRATAYYRETSGKTAASRAMSINLTIGNNIRSISQLGKFFMGRGISIISMEPVVEQTRKEKTRISLSFSINITIPLGQANRVNEMISELTILPFVERVDVEQEK